MTKDEALKLALQILKRLDNDMNVDVQDLVKAVLAAEEALAQPEQRAQLLFEVDGEMLTASQMIGIELFNFQQATGCDTAAEFLAQPEQEQIAAWLEKECDEQYLADRVRAGDYAKEKGRTENCAALADDIGKRHLSPSLVGVGDKDYTAQPEQEREAFESHWYTFYHSGSIRARSDGTYIHPAVQKAWEAWQARATYSTKE